MDAKSKHTRKYVATFVFAVCLVCTCAALAIGAQRESTGVNTAPVNESIAHQSNQDKQPESCDQGEQVGSSAGIAASPETAASKGANEEQAPNGSQTTGPDIAGAGLGEPNPNGESPVPLPLSGWTTGMASAYGDPGSPTRTATGDIVDGCSMGVAIPLSTPNYRSYFGHAILISYNGVTAIATINDCGALGGRSLDLQPGVIAAFGFSDCPSWGIREISYIIL